MRFVAWLSVWAFAAAAIAQPYPAKPLKIVVGYPPGGSGDFLTRLAADELQKELDVAVIVENKPGAGSNIANEFVARAPNDGYTILNAGHMEINRALYSRSPTTRTGISPRWAASPRARRSSASTTTSRCTI